MRDGPFPACAAGHMFSLHTAAILAPANLSAPARRHEFMDHLSGNKSGGGKSAENRGETEIRGGFERWTVSQPAGKAQLTHQSGTGRDAIHQSIPTERDQTQRLSTGNFVLGRVSTLEPCLPFFPATRRLHSAPPHTHHEPGGELGCDIKRRAAWAPVGWHVSRGYPPSPLPRAPASRSREQISTLRAVSTRLDSLRPNPIPERYTNPREREREGSPAPNRGALRAPSRSPPPFPFPSHPTATITILQPDRI